MGVALRAQVAEVPVEVATVQGTLPKFTLVRVLEKVPPRVTVAPETSEAASVGEKEVTESVVATY